MNIYRSFEQWKNGGFLEHGAPRTEEYTAEELHLVEMGWNYGYDAGRAVEQALDKKAENARELGLSYDDEPAPVQEPVAWLSTDSIDEHYLCFDKPLDGDPVQPLYTTPPAAQPALPPMHASGLVAIKTLLSRDPCAHAKVAIEMIDEMLAAAPQPVPVKTYHDGKPWPVAPKPWVGLTRSECLQIEKDMMKYYDYQHECKTVCLPEFARAIEDKLREKNGGAA